MEAQKTQNSAPSPAMSSCRKNKRDDATFLQDVKDHIDEFIHASMDEHKECFKKTMNKMFGMTRKVGERNAEQGEWRVCCLFRLQFQSNPHEEIYHDKD